MIFDGLTVTLVPGLEAILGVTECGLVYSVRKRRWYKLGQDVHGYWRFDTTVNGRRCTFLVHRLLMRTFCPQPDESLDVAHDDNDPSNFKLSNLLWNTRSQNMDHCVRSGRHVSTRAPERIRRGERHGMARLTQYQVEDIKRRRETGMLLREIAGEFQCSVPTVSMICAGKTWLGL